MTCGDDDQAAGGQEVEHIEAGFRLILQDAADDNIGGGEIGRHAADERAEGKGNQEFGGANV